MEAPYLWLWLGSNSRRYCEMSNDAMGTKASFRGSSNCEADR
jgi:hypothetical protein